MESGKPTHFTVVTKGAGKAPLDVSFSSSVKDFDIIDNYDYSHTVKYTPVQQVRLQNLLPHPSAGFLGLPDSFQRSVCLQGEMAVSVTFGGDPISNSPFTVGVAAPLDLGKVSVDNLDGSKTLSNCRL